MIKVSIVADKAAWFQGALLLAGLMLFSYGAYLAWRPLGFIVGGVFSFGIGILMNKITENK